VLFRQFLNEDLPCASYVIAGGDHAVVVDPAWVIDPYLELAARRGLRIVGVLETHLHDDHVSGRAQLAAATGATVYLPAQTGATDRHETLRDGDLLAVGGVEIETLGTPGHRPEHVSYLVRERGRSVEPRLLLSGDSLLVGGVAWPDLAVDGLDEVIEAALQLHRSLRRFLNLPDHVEIWPGHVGGGDYLHDCLSSTLGYERHTNEGLLLDETAFVRAVILRTPVRPPTAEAVVGRNRSPFAETWVEAEVHQLASAR
jgi:glyoxylase-like metal-dependent hydrolase (beta-lactamase superfamily II)